MLIETKIKKWGNSYGIPISKKVLEKMNLTEEVSVNINIKKKTNLMKVFGIAKTNIPTKKLLQEGREGEHQKDELLLRQLRNN